MTGLVPLVLPPDAVASGVRAVNDSGEGTTPPSVELKAAAPEHHIVHSARKIAVRLRVHNVGRCVLVARPPPPTTASHRQSTLWAGV